MELYIVVAQFKRQLQNSAKHGCSLMFCPKHTSRPNRNRGSSHTANYTSSSLLLGSVLLADIIQLLVVRRGEVA